MRTPTPLGVPGSIGSVTKPREMVFYTVEDMNASLFRKKKEHSIAIPQMNGKIQLRPFIFEPGKPVRMAQDTALLFLDIAPSFRVRNSLGQIVRPRKFGKGDSRTVTLRPHEVVVSVTQVLKPVLHEMARALPGGSDRFTKDTGYYERTELEEFVVSGGRVDEDEDGNPLDTVVAA